ncbi:MAG: sensor histidine kinase, partial [Steroidobacteraceae bacterium]
MKLVLRLTIALFVGMCLVFGAYGYFTVRRERALFEADMQRDARLVGRAVGKTVIETWRRDGQQRALRSIDDASGRPDGM